MTSIRLPEGMKEAIEQLLDYLNKKTGIHLTRSEFIVTAIQFYLMHCLEAKSGPAIRDKLIQCKIEVDSPSDSPVSLGDGSIRGTTDEDT